MILRPIKFVDPFLYLATASRQELATGGGAGNSLLTPVDTKTLVARTRSMRAYNEKVSDMASTSVKGVNKLSNC